MVPRICQILPRIVPGENGIIVGGYATNCIEISLEMIKSGLDVKIVAPVPEDKLKYLKDHPASNIIDALPFKGRSLIIRGLNSINLTRHYLKLNKHKFDIFHSHSGTFPYAISSQLVNVKKSKRIHSLYCPISTKGGIYGRVWNTSGNAKIVLNRMDKVIAVSKNVYNNLIFSGLSSEKLITIPMAIDSKHFSLKPIVSDPPCAYNKQRTYKLLFIGNASNEKGLRELIEVVHILIKRHRNIHLTVTLENQSNVRDYGERKTNIIKLIAELGLDIHISVIGLVKSMEYLYDESDILIIPWKTNSGPSDYPKVAMEAMARGTTVITTPLDGCRELLESGKLGFIAKNFGTESIVSTIEYVMEHPSQAYEKIGDAQVKAKSFSSVAVTKRMIYLYNELLQVEKPQ